MGDIKRNNDKKVEPVVEKKEVELNHTKDNNIQIHFGNVKLVELKLLESINKQLAEMLTILRDANK